MSLYRKIIKIKGEDSPNVRFALSQIANGLQVTNEILVPGVLSYADYVKRRNDWDEIRQCVSLDAEFYEGDDLKLYPPTWIDQAERRAAELDELERAGKIKRRARAIGCDTAEGGDKSSWCVVDDLGILLITSRKTPNTAEIPRITVGLMREWGVPASKVCFDRGGGGYEHACTLREQGHDVQTVAFGEALKKEITRRTVTLFEERKELDEERYVYESKRVKLYHDVRQMINPNLREQSWGIPRRFSEKGMDLRQQMAPIPLKYNEEGRLTIPPKSSDDKNKVTLISLIGHSPDELDSVVLAVYAMAHEPPKSYAGAI